MKCNEMYPQSKHGTNMLNQQSTSSGVNSSATASTVPTSNQCPSPFQMVQQYHSASTSSQQPSYPTPQHEYTRRESLVKPTWPTVAPGQVPPSALSNIGNGLDLTSQQHQQHHQQHHHSQQQQSTNGNNSSIIGLNSKLIAASNQKKEVELFDLFGKVKYNLPKYLHIGKVCGICVWDWVNINVMSMRFNVFSILINF